MGDFIPFSISNSTFENMTFWPLGQEDSLPFPLNLSLPARVVISLLQLALSFIGFW
jgi:hypothetical protein